MPSVTIIFKIRKRREVFCLFFFPASMFSCCCSVTKSCPTPCDPIDCSRPDFPVLHYLLEFAQTHVHWVCDAIQPFHPLPSPSPFAFQHDGPLNESFFILGLKYWNFISFSSECSGLISFRNDWFDLLAVQGTLKTFFPVLDIMFIWIKFTQSCPF